MSFIFPIATFEPEIESWNRYAERLEIFFTANEITDDKRKKAIFLTLLSPRIYNLLHDLCIPCKLMDEELTCEDFNQKLHQHFNPTPSAIVERTKFINRFRKPEESISMFIAELRKLAEYCKFGSNLNEALRDRFIAGIQDEGIQKKLLAEGDGLQLNRALEIALAMESAFKDSRNLFHRNNDFEAVNKLKPRNANFSNAELNNKSWKKYICIRCNSDKHKQENCPFLKSKCHFCSKIGHLKRSCLLERKYKLDEDRKRGVNQKKVNCIDEEIRKIEENNNIEMNLNEIKCKEEPTETFEIFNISELSKPPKPWNVKFIINGDKFLQMEYDTGSAYSIISMQTFRYLNLANSLLCNDGSVALVTYSGTELKVKGTIIVNVRYNNCNSKLPLIVVEGNGVSLCGRNWIDHFKLTPENLIDSQVHALNQIPSAVEVLLRENQKIFDPGYGMFKDVKVKLLINPDITPKLQRNPITTNQQYLKDDTFGKNVKSATVWSKPPFRLKNRICFKSCGIDRGWKEEIGSTGSVEALKGGSNDVYRYISIGTELKGTRLDWKPVCGNGKPPLQ